MFSLEVVTLGSFWNIPRGVEWIDHVGRQSVVDTLPWTCVLYRGGCQKKSHVYIVCCASTDFGCIPKEVEITKVLPKEVEITKVVEYRIVSVTGQIVKRYPCPSYQEQY